MTQTGQFLSCATEQSSLELPLILTKSEFARHISINVHNTKRTANPPTSSQVGTCGRTDRQTETIKLIGAFRDTTNAPKMEYNEKYINLAHDVDQW